MRPRGTVGSTVFEWSWWAPATVESLQIAELRVRPAPQLAWGVEMETLGRLQVQHRDAARRLLRADGLRLQEAAGHTLTSLLSWLAYLIGSAVIWRSRLCDVSQCQPFSGKITGLTLSRLCRHPRGNWGGWRWGCREWRILCQGRCLPKMKTALSVFARSHAKSEEQASCWLNHLMIEEVVVFKSEATLWDWEHHSSLILALDPLSHSASLCDCQLIRIPLNTCQLNTASQKLCWLNSATVAVLSGMKRCYKDGVRRDCVRNVQHGTCVRFLARRTFSRFLLRHIWSCCVRLPLNNPFTRHSDLPFTCNKRCEIALSALLPPGIHQPANSVGQTHSQDAKKPRWSFSVIWEAEKEIEWDLSLLSLLVHSPEESSYLRSAPLCRPRWLLQFPFAFFLLCK